MLYDIIPNMNKRFKSVAVVGITLITIGICLGVYYKYSNPAPLSSFVPVPPILQGVITNNISISQGAQGQFGNLRIGLGNNRVDDYTDENGVKKHGNIARLWISVLNDSTQDRTLDVYAGQSFIVDKYYVFVDQITIDHNFLPSDKTGGQGGSISLLIWENTK